MAILQDPIILALLIFMAICAAILLFPHRRTDFWLVVMTLALFLLPRAGVLVPQLHLPLPFAHVLSVLVIGGWLLIGRKWRPEKSAFRYYFLFYVVTIGIGLAIGLGTGGNYKTAFLELMFYFISMGLFFFACTTFNKRRHFLLFARLLFMISIGVSLYGIAQRYLGEKILVNYVTYNSLSNSARTYIDQGGDINTRRVLSSYGDPNVLASQLLVFAGMALAVFVGKNISGRMRLLAILVFILTVICTVYTGSRAGLIALSIIVLIVMHNRTRLALLFIPVLVIMAWMWGPDLVERAISARFGGTLIPHSDIRGEFPKMAWYLLQEYPFGCGLGNHISLQVQGTDWMFVVKPSFNVWSGFNSFWLNLFSRLGVPGVLGFLMLILTLVHYIWRKAKQIDTPLVKAVLIGVLAGFIGQGLIWLVNNTFMLPGGGLNFWFMLGMLMAGCQAYRTDTLTNPVMLPEDTCWTFPQPVPG